ncbi:MAG: InlB B-repeat-containing protein [Bacillales bacterium]|nr:InlB B-repeat-containing protein [Bacillales bacterium]
MKKLSDTKKLLILIGSFLGIIILLFIIYIFFTKRYVVVFTSENGQIKERYHKVTFSSDLETKITPLEGYTFDSITGCSDAYYFEDKLIIKNIKQDLVCNVVFKKIDKKVSINVSNATVIGNKEITVEYLDDAVFLIDKKDKTYFSKSTCKNTSFDSNTNKLTISGVTDNLDCDITFADYITVDFDTDSNDIVDSQKLYPHSSPTKPKNPEKEGYTFVGWYYNDILFDFNTKLDSSITLVAKWTRYFDIELDYKRIYNTSIDESFLKNTSIIVEENNTIRIPLTTYNYILLSDAKVVCSGVFCPIVSLTDKEITIKNLTKDVTININYSCNIDYTKSSVIDISYSDLLCLTSAPVDDYFIYVYDNRFIDSDYEDLIAKEIKAYKKNDDVKMYKISREELSDLSSKYESNNAYYLAYINGKDHSKYSILTGKNSKESLDTFLSGFCIGC